MLTRRQHGKYWAKCRSQVKGVRQRFGIDSTAVNAAFVHPVRYSRYGYPINDCPASALGSCPPIAGNLTLKCARTLITWPYTPGGRSRRGSPKASINVVKHFVSSNIQFHRNIFEICADTGIRRERYVEEYRPGQTRGKQLRNGGVKGRDGSAEEFDRMADDRLPKRAAELRGQGRRRRGRPRRDGRTLREMWGR